MAASMTPHGFNAELYHCLLDEQPYYLVPERLLKPGEPPDGLMVNPRCWFSWHGPLPPDKSARWPFCERMHPADWMIWVDDAATGIVWPYWVGHEFASRFHGLTPGEPCPDDLPDSMRWVLWQADVLLTAYDLAEQRRAWMARLQDYVPAFGRGYVAVSGIIHPFHIGALRRYYRARTRAGAFQFGDSQVSLRYAAMDEEVSAFFHAQLASAVSDIAGTVVEPSYSYLAGYQSGSELPVHLDRPECEYSVSFCCDVTPEPEAQAPWPIQLDTPDGRLKIWQHIGDCLVYRGRYLPHSREVLAHGHTSSSLLFHFVDHGFNGSAQPV
jgi:hypothetical protein